MTTVEDGSYVFEAMSLRQSYLAIDAPGGSLRALEFMRGHRNVGGIEAMFMDDSQSGNGRYIT